MDKVLVIAKILWGFIKKNRLFSIIVLVAILGTITAISIATHKNHKADPEFGVTEKFEQNNDEELVALILNYYYAYSTGDTASVQAYATPLSDEEKSYIEFYSKYIDAFENVKLYTKRGVTDGSYLVSAYVDLRFTGVSTPAPGLDFFYVDTNQDGNLYINNLYGSFNQSNGIYELDPAVTALIAKYEQQKDVIELQEKAQADCDEAVSSDSALATLVSDTLSNAIVEWSTNYKAEIARREEEEAKAAEEQAKKDAEAAEEENAFYGTATELLNVRALPSKDGSKIGQLNAGQKVKIYGKDGDFYKIEFDNRKAYAYAQYIKVEEKKEETSTDANTSTSTDTSASGATTSTSTSTDKVTVSKKKEYYFEGDKVTVKANRKVYESMMADAKVAGEVYPGQVLTVVYSYSDGFTLIKADGVKGYIKTTDIN